MASSRSKTQVGSAPWLLNERQQANELIEQEVEEFTYSVRNEMEWLNEHMAEIFTRNQLYGSPTRCSRSLLTARQKRRGHIQNAWEATRQDPADGAEEEPVRDARCKLSLDTDNHTY